MTAGGFALRRVGAGLDDRFERALPTADVEVAGEAEPLLPALGRLFGAVGVALLIVGGAMLVLELLTVFV